MSRHRANESNNATENSQSQGTLSDEHNEDQGTDNESTFSDESYYSYYSYYSFWGTGASGTTEGTNLSADEQIGLLDPNSISGQKQKGVDLYSNGEFDRAEDHFIMLCRNVSEGEVEEALQVQAQWLPPIRTAQNLLGRGQHYLAEGNWPAAQKEFLKLEQSMRTEPGKAWVKRRNEVVEAKFGHKTTKGNKEETQSPRSRRSHRVGYEIGSKYMVYSMIDKTSTGMVREVHLQGNEELEKGMSLDFPLSDDHEITSKDVFACKSVRHDQWKNPARFRNEADALKKATDAKIKHVVKLVEKFQSEERKWLSNDKYRERKTKAKFRSMRQRRHGGKISERKRKKFKVLYDNLVLWPRANCDLMRYFTIEGKNRSIPEACKPEILGRLRTQVFGWIYCLSATLSRLHELDIRHRDIRPANILIYGEDILFADFGMSFSRGTGTGSNLNKSHGGQRYAPPESRGAILDEKNGVAEDATEEVTTGKSSDVFSLGCVLFELLSQITEQVVQDKRFPVLPENATSYADFVERDSLIEREEEFRTMKEAFKNQIQEYEECQQGLRRFSEASHFVGLTRALLRFLFDSMIVELPERLCANCSFKHVSEVMQKHGFPVSCVECVLRERQLQNLTVLGGSLEDSPTVTENDVLQRCPSCLH